MRTLCEKDLEPSAPATAAVNQCHIGTEHDQLCTFQPGPAHCSWNLKYTNMYTIPISNITHL